MYSTLDVALITSMPILTFHTRLKTATPLLFITLQGLLCDHVQSVIVDVYGYVSSG